jgi:hypothetical protein
VAVEQRSRLVQDWPEESQEAAQLVIDARGEPDEVTPTQLTGSGSERRLGSGSSQRRSFSSTRSRRLTTIQSSPSSTDSVPVDQFTPLAEFDGSVVCERTAGEISARCHDEQANYLALNLSHEIVTGARTVQEARDYYAKEFLGPRRKQLTPYMEGLRSARHPDLPPTRTNGSSQTSSSRRRRPRAVRPRFGAFVSATRGLRGSVLLHTDVRRGQDVQRGQRDR